MRRQPVTREDHIPAGAIKVAHKHSSAVAYLYESGGKPAAMVFHGRLRKPAWRYRFQSVQRRDASIAGYFASVQHREESRAALKAKGRGVVVGDILATSWGYEQTNIEWFEVTALIGTTMVEVRELAAGIEETHWQQGKTVPLPGAYKGEPLRRQARDGSVRIDDVRTAYRVEPTHRIGGKGVYAAQHFTAYH